MVILPRGYLTSINMDLAKDNIIDQLQELKPDLIQTHDYNFHAGTRPYMRERFAFRQIGMLPTWMKNKDGEEKEGTTQQIYRTSYSPS